MNERFPERGKNVVKNKYNKICFVKTIIRGHIQGLHINNNHLELYKYFNIYTDYSEYSFFNEDSFHFIVT